MRLLRLGLALVAVTAQGGETTAPTASESWYSISPVGGVPPLNAYPEGTLHVGVTAGLEDARTYLTLDVPDDVEVVGGELRLPVDADPTHGSRDVESAAVEVCFVPQPGDEVAGSTDPPPAVDCSLREPATLVDGVFVVDLDRFVAVLDDGGIAVQPVAAALASWHVTIHGRASATPITATLQLADAGPAAPPLLTPPAPAPVTLPAPRPAGDAASLAGPPAFVVPAVTAPAVVVPPPASGSAPGVPLVPRPAAPAPVASVGIGEGGFAYGIVFAAPLLLLAFGGYFASALVRPVVIDRASLRARAASIASSR